jgi:hypothetical protein
MSDIEKYNSRGNWWYEDDPCKEEGCDTLIDSCDNEYAYSSKGQRIIRCREHYDYLHRKRHGKANPITNAVSARAIEKAGGQAVYDALPKNGKERRELRAEARDEILAEKEQPDNILPFKPKEAKKPAKLKSARLKSHSRNKGLPQGIVTKSEQRVRQEKKKIKYVPEGWTYAAKDHMKEPGYLKLGKTNDLSRRLSELNTAGDFEMMHWVKVPDVKEAEDMLHHHFKSQHYLREWFEVSTGDAIEAMDAIGDIVNDPDWEGIVDMGEADES